MFIRAGKLFCLQRVPFLPLSLRRDWLITATSRHADIGPDRTVARVYLKCMFVSGTIPPIAYVHNVTSPHAFCSLVRPNTSDRAALKSREIIVRERIVDESVPLLPHL